MEEALLSADEWRQAQSFSRMERRQQFIEIRTLVRRRLSAYVGCLPQQLNILRTTAGKPYLADYPEVFFNLSHCQKQWVLVITTGRRIGVDIEIIRPRKGMEALVKRCFSHTERQRWNGFSEAEKQRWFYHYWTAKEAFVKAVGRGIALGLEKVQVAWTPQPELRQIPAGYGDEQDWRLLMLPGQSLQVAMICVEAMVAEDIELKMFKT